MRWLLRPWTWMIAALISSGAALAWARISINVPPLDLPQLGLVSFGVLAAGIALWRRASCDSGLNDLDPLVRGRLLNVLAAIHCAIAVAITAVLFFRLTQPVLPGTAGGMVLFWVLSVPWCVWSAWQLMRSSMEGRRVDNALESAVLTTLAALAAFMGSWAFYWPEYWEEWDSMRLFLAVLAAAGFIAAPLVAAPPRLRRLGVSALIVAHMTAILTVVIGQPPGPYVVRLIHHWVFRPYIEFMYLNNGYRFYSPEPGPASQLWCRIEYEVGGKKLPGIWFKLPDMDERGNPRYATGLQYTRRLALTETIARTDPPLAMMITNEKGEPEPSPIFRDRDLNSPRPTIPIKLGQKTPEQPAGIPYHPELSAALQYQKPTYEGRRFLTSYSRYLLHHRPHPTIPEARAVRVKIFRVQHQILPAQLLAMGIDPWDLTLYFPYYVGEFDAEGNLLNPNDPLLYWLLPNLHDDPSKPDSPVKCYAYKYAGDPAWIIKPAVSAAPQDRRFAP
jgi:hypothetical protein